MKWKPVLLELSDEQLQTLKAQNREIRQAFEQKIPIKTKTLEALQQSMAQALAGNSALNAVLQELADSGEHITVQLRHSDSDILNLPWALAEVPPHGRLADLSQLYLARCLPERVADAPLTGLAAPPLKILIMISSPINSDHSNRLSYEEEELQILTAFQPLMQSGLVEIDFTDDGSLESLRRKLQGNHYHILHFSGHGVFHDGTGYLELENPLTLNSEKVSDRDFAEAVNCDPDYRVPLVLLSSCQSAQGENSDSLTGVGNQLLKIGVPAVIAMNMPVRDDYATFFAAQFYDRIAARQAIPAAFKTALDRLRQKEFDDQAQARRKNPLPMHWLIPTLYMTGSLQHLVDWQEGEQKLHFDSYRFITENNRLLLRHHKEYLFIGRRREKAAVLTALFDRKPVLLTGQGGVGKTAMAEYCVQRLIAAEPNTHPFLFGESCRSLQDCLDILQNTLIERGHSQVITALAQLDKAMDKFHYLIFEAAKVCSPVFIFDNLETFQRAPGERFAEEHSDLEEAIFLLCSLGRFPVILTCRYPLAGVPDVHRTDLNQVGLTDFWKKCHQLALHSLEHKLRQTAGADQAVRFIDFVALLHETLGGNYRALEFFDGLYREAPEAIDRALQSLQQLREQMQQRAGRTADYMRDNLSLPRLMELLEDRHRRLLRLLCHFRIPVQVFALRLQLAPEDPLAKESLPALLDSLHDLTLIEISLAPETRLAYYYATPIVRDMVSAGDDEPAVDFSARRAGSYHYHVYRNLDASLTELEEAFFYFDAAGVPERLQEIGKILADVYYNSSLYRSALHYAGRVYAVLGKQTDPWLLNCLGRIFDLFGDYDQALPIFNLALDKFRTENEKSGEGATLNNMATTTHARGDYDAALKYLKQSLKISSEIGDKIGKGTTLNNISQIYDARGDYNTALDYLLQSLKVFQELGDRSSEGTTLNNISQIYASRGFFDSALEYLLQSLKITREIGDRRGEGTTLNNISQTYKAQGDYDTALEYLKLSLKITFEIGDKHGEGTTLNNISQIYAAHEDYDTALEYLLQSLKIKREIGDRRGEGTTLNNISQIFDALGDYDTALEYLKQSLKITREIGDKSGEGTTLHNMAMIALEKKDHVLAFKLESEAYTLALKTGDAQLLFGVGQIFGPMVFHDGDKETGLAILEKSYQIGIEAGLPGAEELRALIQRLRQG